MLSNITSNSSKETLLTQGDVVYLYGDTNYTGTLIRPIDRTYPPKWTVELERGGYEAVNVQHISLVESKSTTGINSHSEIPFSDAPEEISHAVEPSSVPVSSNTEATYAQLQQEIAALKRENAQLKQENELVKKDLDCAKQIIRRAKDISPLMRISLKRVLRLAHDACMDVQRTVGGWILRMGGLARKFRRLADIWELLSVDEFLLSEIFPEDKRVAVELILPPKRRKKPEPPEKKTFPSFDPRDIARNRIMFKVSFG